MRPEDLFGEIPVMVIGGVATRAYMPERYTKDIGFLVKDCDFAAAREMLRKSGYRKRSDLAFPGSTLGLYGEAWVKQESEIDVISSEQPWCEHAFRGHVEDQTGLRVIGLPFLVLMKFDAARGVDQGDLTRMLGRLSDERVEEIASLVAMHIDDPDSAQEIRQYAQLGRWELGKE